jgi:hypothetical protein
MIEFAWENHVEGLLGGRPWDDGGGLIPYSGFRAVAAWLPIGPDAQALPRCYPLK